MVKKFLGLTSALVLSIGLTACGGNEETEDNGNASSSIGEEVEHTIVGIDPGAGIMEQASDMLSEYELENWEVQESSGAAMAAELGSAIDEEEPIIVTGWIPHWKFFEFDLKMLDDPQEVYGGEEDIHTLVRQGLEEDMPGAYTFFDQFQWEPDHLQNVMLKIEEGLSEEEAAQEWVEENQDLVDSWVEGAEPGDGAEVSITYVAWADVIASSNVVKYVMENELDYQVELVQVEPGPMFASVADGTVDAMVGAWLPSTHAAYYEEYEGDFEDLGANLSGTRNGLVVPSYMDIDSIEDLKESNE
ncbi:glycine betaine ABC transporter substrate-binding protein [Lentibacillus sp. CBA3610]|uniref:glycine betaine ABC transporter substrate-binding protein n=1 Tax=Lentibacillus sp. CBA3610 TaxID=2518176 RepID=UPI001594F80E|nr:glycine betaine ABC transporter substrate-binding protein [Lentibacillus sp. CBA3610]QKY71072.1 glycine/betaine ABC transporter [Lentibacillus sp. CBA3610]